MDYFPTADFKTLDYTVDERLFRFRSSITQLIQRGSYAVNNMFEVKRLTGGIKIILETSNRLINLNLTITISTSIYITIEIQILKILQTFFLPV